MNYYEFLKATGAKLLWERRCSHSKSEFFDIVYMKDGIIQRKNISNPGLDLGVLDWMEFQNKTKDNETNPEWNPTVCHEQGSVVYINYNWYILLHTGGVEKVPKEISDSLTRGEDYYFRIETEEEIPIDEECSAYKQTCYICEDVKCSEYTKECIVWRMEITRKGFPNDSRYID